MLSSFCHPKTVSSIFNQGKYTQAIQYYDKALAVDPNYKDALNGKGASVNGLGNYTQAIPLRHQQFQRNDHPVH